MPFDTWKLYLLTVLVFMSTPGPSHLLMLSNSASHGFRRSLATAAGDLTANFLQMLAAGFGLAAILAAASGAFTIVKWLGVAYLVYLGLRMIVGAGRSANGSARFQPASIRTLWLQGFVTSAANPKAVVFFAALFPQFMHPDQPFVAQFAILAATYIVIDGLFLAAYGAGAEWISSRFRGNARTWIERAGGMFMLVAALLLGLKSLRSAN
ncbi:MAG: LysE family transporter [Woeseiaceae bacterium]|nr:LysE family transporter [Woeseiaceae bacterium]